MANPGSKFVSVNLNKSYGNQHNPSHNNTHYSSFNGGGGGGSYGRGRGGGGGMVVLSRNQGAAPKKLSVPPPLNLPSLRKEHEKFDTLGPGGGPGGGAGSGTGPRPTSSGVGWTKPVVGNSSTTEKNESVASDVVGVSRSSGSYMPPSARSNGAGLVGSGSVSRTFAPSSVEKAVVLRGEDFPSLQAARPVSSGGSQKQKDGSSQKQKQVAREESAQDKKENYQLGQPVDTHPQGPSSRNSVGNQLVENGGVGSGADQTQKQEKHFPDPLAMVHINPRSNWEDDERGTSHGFEERRRESGYSNSESYWDRDFDFPRPSLLPHKQNQYDTRVQRDNETGKNFSSEVLKMDPYHKDVRAPSREGKEVNSFRSSPLSKGGFNSQDVGNYRSDAGSRMAGHNNMLNENRYTPAHYGDSNRDGNIMLNRDSTHGRRDPGLVGRNQQRNIPMDSFNIRGPERSSWDRHTTEQPNRYRGGNFQNNTLSKPSVGKLLPINDPILTMGRDKRFSKNDRSFTEDYFSRDYGSSSFDEGDLFSGGLVGVIKRKKDAAKLTDFHDPVRESFEAELERVQKMQELERQRIVEEQERVVEHARREEDERQRRIRDEEESRRRVEEEAKEAEWRVEQEQVEAIRKAEEQRIAREEEKRRMEMEEERRKQAAKQKLQELEERMAKRRAEGVMGDAPMSNTIVDEKLEVTLKEKDISRSLDLDTWEDGERMVENVTASSSYEMSLRPYPPREGFSNISDRGKGINSWRRDIYNGDSFPSQFSDPDTSHYSPKRDAFGGDRAAPRAEFNGGAGYMSSRTFMRAGVQEPYSDEFGYQRDHRWGLSGDADSYGKFREMDSEYHDRDKNGDGGWGLGRAHGNTHHPYPERLYPHSEANELYSHGRSRYSMRQPRVLPPPSIASAQRSHFRGVTEHSGPPSFLDNGIHYSPTRSESTRQPPSYYGSNQGSLDPSEAVGPRQENSTLEDLNMTTRCESQSSLSVSSPPNSPPHLSHDELDESGDSPVTSTVAGGIRNLSTGNENSGNGTNLIPSGSISAVDDEEWTENDDALQQQEEYDEDEDCYREEDEVRDENFEMNQKFEALEIEERESSHMLDNVVLGFDEGVEVVIPSDDLVEKNLRPGDGFPSDEQSKSAASSSGKVPEQMALEGSIDQPSDRPSSAATVDVLDGSDSFGSTRVAAQHTVPSSSEVSATAGQSNMPSLSSAGSASDLPVQFQFGLFSGPSLIPSPVPAIQIGSIQMPLHIHPPIGSSLPHLHPSQPPMFQFGQLRYTSPISQGILPLPTQSMSFILPNMPGQFNLNQKTGASVSNQPARDASTQNVTKHDDPSIPLNKPEQSNVSCSQVLNSVPDSREDKSIDRLTSSGVSSANNQLIKPGYGSQAVKKGHHDAVLRERGYENHLQHVQPAKQSVSGERNLSGHRGLGPVYGGRGKRLAYAVKNANARTSFQSHDITADPSGFQRRPRRTVQRTEFRIRENNDRRAGPLLISSYNTGSDDRSNYLGKAVGGFTRSGSKRGAMSNRNMKQRTESEPSTSGKMISHEVGSGDRVANEMPKNLSVQSENTSHSGEANLRKNVSEDDVDAPIESGVVRVFKQPGIEAPSDEDDFIEVKSKRQMLNDRREQREKEMKAKLNTNKQQPRKPRSTRQRDVVSRSHNKLYVPLRSDGSRSSQLNFTSDRPHFVNKEGSTGFATAVSQQKVGTPAVSSEVQPVKPPQAGSLSVASRSGAECDLGLIFDRNDTVMDLPESTSTTWNTAGINQQTQINEAIEPARYDSHISAVGGHTSTVSDPILPTSSVLTKDKTFSSNASPISSLLAGEKIQFGAVTSPTVLPPSTRVVSHGIGAPGSNRPDLQMPLNFPVSESDTLLFFEKGKHLSDSCVPLQDGEAEAEAAASAVAVAAISNDEIVGNGLGSVNNTKSFGSADMDGLASGVVHNQHMTSQSRSEELSVSLPADLSVETTPISLWPPLASPQSSSSQMLSHFPGGAPSHFPFYEMNPLLGGQIFAFSPHEESSGSQSQPQKSTTSTSGPLGNWQQCHSGVDSFYGHPAGYPVPFIGPPGSISGVQGPPHMVVYNHFAPVGQYGQVGLSFMGTTYIPSGKQADWKNTTTSSPMHTGEGDISNMNMNTLQRNAPIQHLAPGSPLLPMPSPLPIFDASPFQTANDLPVQARWGHIPTSQLHSVPVSRPLQQAEVALPSQVNHGHTIDQSSTGNRFTESRNPTPSDNSSRFPAASDTNISQFSAELGLVDPLRSNTTSAGQSSAIKSSTASASADPCKTDKLESGMGSNVKHRNANSVKTQFSQKSSGYNYQRGGVSQRNNPGNDWSHRRMGFHGRNQSTGMDKSYPPAKVKQIYVAKQTTTGSSTS